MENEELKNKPEDEEVNEVEETELSDETFTYSIDNNNVNNDYNKNDGKGSIIYVIIGVVILISIIAVLVFFANKGKSKVSGYKDIESRMVSGAKSYYEKNSNLLPIMDSSSVSVSTDTLIENSFLKPFSEMVDEGVSCTGSVTVYNIDGEYGYFPYLNCGNDYESVTLSKKIISDAVVTSGDGLYLMGDKYIYRGEYPNNYVKIGDKSWRIIGVNSDGSIKLIYDDKKVERVAWDDRYNSEKESYFGINDFRVSRLLEYLKKIYNDNTFIGSDYKTLLVKHDWCIGKVSEDDVLINDMNVCGDIYNDLYIGVVDVYDVLLPSLDKNCDSMYDIECTNYNYFLNINTGMTLNASSNNSYVIFSSNEGSIMNKNASIEGYARPVINLNSNVLYVDGDGTIDNPYIIKQKHFLVFLTLFFRGRCFYVDTG